jgi:hypothetical protein
VNTEQGTRNGEGVGMGRTVPTFTQVILQEMESWTKFRRGRRRKDQEALDDLFRAARMQLAGSAYAARPIPFESMIMAMLIMQQRMIRKLVAQREIAGAVAGHDDTGSPFPDPESSIP